MAWILPVCTSLKQYLGSDERTNTCPGLFQMDATSYLGVKKKQFSLTAVTCHATMAQRQRSTKPYFYLMLASRFNFQYNWSLTILVCIHFFRAYENKNSSQNTGGLCNENCPGIPQFTSKFLQVNLQEDFFSNTWNFCPIFGSLKVI